MSQDATPTRRLAIVVTDTPAEEAQVHVLSPEGDVANDFRAPTLCAALGRLGAVLDSERGVRAEPAEHVALDAVCAALVQAWRTPIPHSLAREQEAHTRTNNAPLTRIAEQLGITERFERATAEKDRAHHERAEAALRRANEED